MGNKYQVDLLIKLDLNQAAQTDQLSSTLNYETVYRIVSEEMKIPSKLLEHIAQRIITQMYLRFPELDSVEVSVSKHNPPVGGVCKWARVTLKR